MKTTVVIGFVLIGLMPLKIFTQNEGIKNVSPAPAKEGTAMYAKTTQEMAMVQDLGKTGGTAGEAGLSGQSGMYLLPGWMNGYVVLKDNTLLDKLSLRYDLYHQQMQFIRNNDTLAFRNPDELLMLSLDGKKFVYTGYEKDKIVTKGYFEVLTDGKCKLLLRRSIKYHLDPESGPRLTEEVYVEEKEYYVKKNDDLARPVRVCKKSALCAFDDRKDEMRDYIDANRLKMKTCDDLMLLVEYYNSLN